MAFDQLDIVLQFCIRLFAIYVITIGAIKLSRRLSRPVATYGAGLPERRRRPRIVIEIPKAPAGQQQDVMPGLAA